MPSIVVQPAVVLPPAAYRRGIRLVIVPTRKLPVGAIESADLVATTINDLAEETLQDALAAVHAEIEEDSKAA